MLHNRRRDNTVRALVTYCTICLTKTVFFDLCSFQTSLTAVFCSFQTYSLSEAQKLGFIIIAFLSIYLFPSNPFCLKIADEPVPFGLAAFNEEGNEIDTLDGVQIAWFIGSDRDIAEIKVKQVICVFHQVMKIIFSQIFVKNAQN